MRHLTVLSLLLFILLTFSCGNGDDSDAKPSDLSLELFILDSSNNSVQSIARGETVTFVLKVSNNTSAAITVTYGSSQQYDFTVLTNETEIWKWSHDLVFATVVWERIILPLTTLSFEEEWTQVDNNNEPVDSGTYTLKALYIGNNEEQTMEFTIEE